MRRSAPIMIHACAALSRGLRCSRWPRGVLPAFLLALGARFARIFVLLGGAPGRPPPIPPSSPGASRRRSLCRALLGGAGLRLGARSRSVSLCPAHPPLAPRSLRPRPARSGRHGSLRSPKGGAPRRPRVRPLCILWAAFSPRAFAACLGLEAAGVGSFASRGEKFAYSKICVYLHRECYLNWRLYRH